MKTCGIERLNKRDADLCRAFRAIILKGKFEVQGEALAQVGAMFRWFQDLDKRIEETLAPPQSPPQKLGEGSNGALS